ncbi:MAG: ADP-ribosyl-[dinitrogen reductase] glycohydrolase [Saprospiraceae bacterium]|nr:ADP-ribosyl-[dinitrogen reductase] glycohydrolase [Saprospiraceae bacterium]
MTTSNNGYPTGHRNLARAAILGLVVGDALGVPVEFIGRDEIMMQPVTGMRGYGTHQQPPGTWSDDSSLTLCLAEVLTAGYDLQRIGNSFVKWLHQGLWTARGQVFDVGIATMEALGKLANGVQPDQAGGTSEYSNGNGSLMRILPLLFYIRYKPGPERFEITRQVSSLTHAHVRSVLACFYYLEFLRLVCEGKNKFEAYSATNGILTAKLQELSVTGSEAEHFNRILQGDLRTQPEEAIRGSGYVIHTLEASLWCVLTSDSYREAVLKAVNLGEDADTTGAVTGGMAGIVFGEPSIPNEWVRQIARMEDIERLIVRFQSVYAEACL